MKFSDRTAWEPELNLWAAAVDRRRSAGLPLVDLTVSNPTACGLGPVMATLPDLGDPAAQRYTPDPLGMPAARAAVVAYYADHGATVAPEHICLTTSTSEAYSFLFRVLCDPGDEVLIARPSYPLFDLLARVEDVRLREYPLFYEPGQQHGGRGGWALDRDGLLAALTPRTRALVLVHPNNPTGNYVLPEDRHFVEELCARRGLALLVDEVFLDYGTDDQTASATQVSFAGGDRCLCFVLSGVSKVCALPQMKLSWLAASGPATLVHEALRRIEIVSDTFLSVSAPVQWALPLWLAERGPVQAAIRQRLAANLAVLDTRLAGTSANRLQVEGGWTAVLRVPRFVEGEAFALAALERGVLVQPGSFYGLREGRCVVSLLTEPERWREGLARLPI